MKIIPKPSDKVILLPHRNGKNSNTPGEWCAYAGWVGILTDHHTIVRADGGVLIIGEETIKKYLRVVED